VQDSTRRDSVASRRRPNFTGIEGHILEAALAHHSEAAHAAVARAVDRTLAKHGF
jgi:hypothetical protein